MKTQLPAFPDIDLVHQLGSTHRTTLVTPLDVEDLCRVVRELGTGIRPSGIACSTTVNMLADAGYTVSLQHFKTLRMVTHDTIEIGAGVMAEELLSFLDSHQLQIGANFTFPFFRLGALSVSCYACEAYHSGQSYFSSHVIRYDIVTADGEPLVVDETQNAHLLPFLRTSVGLLGMVTSFRMRVYPNGQFGATVTLFKSPWAMLGERGTHGMRGVVGWAPYTGLTFIQQHAFEHYMMRPPYTSPGYKLFSWALNLLATFPWRRASDFCLRMTPGSRQLVNKVQLRFKVNPNYVKLKFDDWRNRLFAWDFAEERLPDAMKALDEILQRYRRKHGHEIVLVGIWRFEQAPPEMRGHLHTNFDGNRQSCVIVTDHSTDRKLQEALEAEWSAVALSLGGRPQLQKGDYAPADFQAAFGEERIAAFRSVIYEMDPRGVFAHPQLTRLLGLSYPGA